MDATTLIAIVMVCAPQVDSSTARALVAVESGLNPFAIGVVGGTLLRQPRHRAEAVATARALHAGGWDFSVGLAQINQRNFARLGLTIESAFDPCANLSAMQAVLAECFDRATDHSVSKQQALRQGLSCYYSGNFTTGFRHGYVRKVTAAASAARGSAPAITFKELS
jgi:type IV secretion system protein VirB1